MKQKTDYRINTDDATALPSNTRLENCVLGLLLEMPVMLNEVYRYLRFPGLFYNTNNAAVWEEITHRFKNGSEISAEALAAEYRYRGQNEMSRHIFTLRQFSEHPAHLEQQCLKLNEYAIQRNIIRLSYDLNITCQEPANDALEALGKASEGLDAIYRHLAKFKTKGIEEGVNELQSEIDRLVNNQGGLLGLSSSLFEINMYLKGYRNGNLIFIAASTGEGKTTLAIQEALYLLEKDIAVGYFSLEMPTADILLKFACTKANVPIDAVLSGQLAQLDKIRFDKALQWLRNSKLLLNDTPGIKIGEIKAQSRMWVKNNDCKEIFLDHIHLTNGDYHYSSPEQKYTDIANQLKELAKEVNIPVISLAQLARKEKGEKRMHQLSDLKYASGIEQAADVVLFIYRPVMYGISANEDGVDISKLAHIYTGKTRLLPGGKFNTAFDGLRFMSHVETGYTIKPQIIPQPQAQQQVPSNLIPMSRFNEEDPDDFSFGFEQNEMF